ncbi:MAG TPA: 30S ribosomal protein S20 [Kiritimatiellia bacterium]|nr:30S ribosomal protein S20 [Kiritimatiellia bacterium]HMO97933.1 30S ribosomal protein S20 [Kiritimatiellia bacterium]HMP95284.1 30S ribosomal protein S20 [Kiritimatiellia bacterium]
MAHTSSAKKKVRIYQEQKRRNSAAKSLIKSSGRKLTKSLDAKESANAQDAYKALCSALDKAAKKGSIKKQTAIRRKARAATRLRATTAA